MTTPFNQLPNTKKPRERLSTLGVSNLTQTELLAILIGSGTKQKSVLATAERVSRSFPENLHRASRQELEKIPGIGPITAGKIIAAIELGNRLTTQPTLRTILKPTDALREAEAIRHSHREQTLGLYLNARYELIKKQTLAIGSLNTTAIEVRDVYAPALALPCRSLVLIHNHPSGNLTPSHDDLDTTKRLQQAGELLGISLLDHLIVTGAGFLSFQQEKLL
jgi:DNA repair protein RadC